MSQQDVYASLTELFTSHAMWFHNETALIEVTSRLANNQTLKLSVKKPYAVAYAIDLALNSMNPLLSCRAQFRPAGQTNHIDLPIQVDLLRRLDNTEMQPILRIEFDTFSAKHSRIFLPIMRTKESIKVTHLGQPTFPDLFVGLNTIGLEGPSAEAFCKALRVSRNDNWRYFEFKRPRFMVVS